MTTTTESLESLERARPAVSGLLAAHQVLGRYEILFPIASGGMATVYAARLAGEGSFQKLVALKCMLPHLASDPRFVAMFMDEAALAARIQSPYVVPVLELSRHDDETLFMALELVLGVSLRELCEASESGREPVSSRIACALLVQAARGLHDAHEARSVTGEPLGIIHRDVSPHNVLVGLDGRARISDFGIARAVERVGSTQTGELKGKLSYFSPEQVRSAELDARSDVFSLGIVAWELLSGSRLFQAPNPLAIAQAVAAKPIPRVDALRPDVPSAVADVVALALERDRDQRPPSAESFADALTQAAESSCGLADAREITAALRAACGVRIERLERELADALREPTASRRALRKRAPRRIARWSVLALGLVVGGVFGLSASLSSPTREQAPRAVSASLPPVAPATLMPAEAAPVVAAQPALAPERFALDASAPAISGPAPSPESRASERARKKVRRAVRRRVVNKSAQPATPATVPNEGLLRGLEEFDRERGR